MAEDTMQEAFSASILLNLSVRMPGNAKKVSDESALADGEQHADHSWLALSKRLIDAEEFDAIKTVTGRMKRFLERKCIVAKGKKGSRPAISKFIKPGIYILPLGLVAEVDAELEVFKREFAEARDKFIEAYPYLQEAAREKLKDLYNQEDYPDADTLKDAFAIEYSYMNVTTPKALEAISAEIFRREQAQAEKQWSEATEEIRMVLRTGFQQLVDWMVEVLSQTEDGERRKSFRESSAGRMMDFLEDFSAKNITKDSELAALIEKAKDLLDGQDPRTMKRDIKKEDWRDAMLDKFSELKTELEPLVQNARVRQIILAED